MLHFIKTKRIFLISLVFLLNALFFRVANAANFTSDFSNFVNFINTNILGQVKKDFCKNYILSLSTGDWKQGEFRTTLGKNVCTSYTVASTTSKITQAIIQTIDNSTVFQTESQSTSSVNNPIPDIYSAVSSSADNSSLNAGKIINLVNSERKENDSTLVNLKENSVLNLIASVRVKDMFDKQYFEHTSPTGDNVSKEATSHNYTYITIGENIALGNFGNSKGVVDAWMNSSGHKANILNKNYTETGVYVMQGNYAGQSVWIAAQVFAKPVSSCVSPSLATKDKVSQYKISAESLLKSINKIDTELKTLNATDTATYNTKVAEKNTLTNLYNNLASEIKTLVAEYNQEVTTYNSCIKNL